ncbi:signal peptide peptidase SppA [Candidatus Providencia siddallii]|uniref:Protease 4 n=1 Tax=Candidatus Providencia siddallii TaxID=1715285 RepID=A0ABM9NNZ1_9GAMM
MRYIYNIILKLFKIICKTIKFIREIIFNTIFIIIIVLTICFFSVYKFDYKQEKNFFGALYIDIQGVVVDQISTPNSLSRISNEIFNIQNNHMQENCLFDIVNAIRYASIDPRITGIILYLDNFFGADQPSLTYIGKAIKEFKNTKKPVYAIGRNYNQSQYYIASFADKIYLYPNGTVNIQGFSTNYIYYKSLLNKLKINSHIFRVGTYKSAVEPLIRNNMSKEVRQINQHLLNTAWNNYLNDLAYNRQLTKKQIFPGSNVILNKLQLLNGDYSQYALNQKLIDKIYTNEKIENTLNKVFGWNKEKKHFNYISIYDYFNKIPETNNISNIAVIVVQGAIIDNKQIFNTDCEKIVSQIRNARLNNNIKAIILRINSPGGSVDASDLIRNELEILHNFKKPIVVSMGGVAASGGYWIATPADYIIASPNTLTGSIGIFTIINTFENSLKSIGINSDSVTTSQLTNNILTKGMNQQLSNMMQLTTKNGYETFIKLVSKSRKKTIKEINKIAQGQVWIGEDALKNGLIDMLGDFDDAINKAAKLANLNYTKLYWIKPKFTFIDQLLIELTQGKIHKILQTLFSYNISTNIKDNIFFLNIENQKKQYAYCFNCTKTNIT